MNLRHVGDLTRVEIQRAKPLLVRLYLAGAAGLVLFYVIGRATDENVLVVVMGVTLGLVVAVPIAVMRDKLDRTLEFLLSLPVTVADLVAARFLAAAAGLLPGVIATGVTLMLVEPPAEWGVLVGVAPFQIALGYWALLTLAAWCLTAAAACELTRLISWSIAAMVVLLAWVAPWALGLLQREGIGAALRSFLEHPYALIAIGVVTLAIFTLLAAAAFGIAQRGVARYPSRPDKPL
ncbi:MAG: ABC transporter permease subunit [Acidobacteria bacterium]|uniref:ABC-2 transporter permease n=1 Tax=Candidatus Palauibacter polyketidifaciens TaxID=3056740 RepID=UPI0013A99A44|nr:ABC-2 transporter permease [Candidatus Palauibacter polyketidifaciens]MDE2719538.1 ABC-2 transporter permease [Candidatus Palauibacter polyketidifaciens]MYN65024.1 ABC transporter permease subunit [Acidobacteriota bacterium]